jgi:hypothetical protein
LKKQPSNNVSEQGNELNEQAESQPNVKMPFVEPMVSTPEDVLDATTFFQAPTVDTSTV